MLLTLWLANLNLVSLEHLLHSYFQQIDFKAAFYELLASVAFNLPLAASFDLLVATARSYWGQAALG